MKNKRKREKPRPLTIKASFVEANPTSPVERLTKATVMEWQDQKHRKPSGEEVELIDSLFEMPLRRGKRRHRPPMRQKRAHLARRPKVPLRGLRKTLHAHHRDRLRLEEDTHIRMGRVRH
ncbi:MAG: hypothetical protein SPL80_00805 [Bacilli bacterium]|nr:hypothetical protein [Bacilli bacterium]